ncbi:MAG: hypothetical protein UX30_C0011G0003 [Candidatus Saccharibacteria bacterium GW2011_GWA2_46_10]|nr:MAG: hypothetical protein UX30_C0011G0003 [Candidatus Saccharibacteria bacterium GW2011_GWA2_46_10]
MLFLYHLDVEFEFDPQKNETNKEKHSIDFETVKKLWAGFSVEFAVEHPIENRFAIIGKIEGKFYTAIYTLREERIRIISCRRSRTKEIKLYEKNFQKTKNT